MPQLAEKRCLFFNNFLETVALYLDQVNPNFQYQRKVFNKGKTRNDDVNKNKII